MSNVYRSNLPESVAETVEEYLDRHEWHLDRPEVWKRAHGGFTYARKSYRVWRYAARQRIERDVPAPDAPPIRQLLYTLHLMAFASIQELDHEPRSHREPEPTGNQDRRESEEVVLFGERS